MSNLQPEHANVDAKARVTPGDLTAVVTVAAVLLVVSVAAIYIPSRRAMRISPARALAGSSMFRHADMHNRWTEERPHTLVVACSDGRLQEATDAFLVRELGLTQFDRFYVPGGGGALAASGRDFIRAQQLRKECGYLIELHDVKRVLLLFHGPGHDGPAAAVCADYHRKMPWASPDQVMLRQRQDSLELIERGSEWAGKAAVSSLRCEVHADGRISFRTLEIDGDVSAAPARSAVRHDTRSR